MKFFLTGTLCPLKSNEKKEQKEKRKKYACSPMKVVSKYLSRLLKVYEKVEAHRSEITELLSKPSVTGGAPAKRSWMFELHRAAQCRRLTICFSSYTKPVSISGEVREGMAPNSDFGAIGPGRAVPVG
ncbi:MAG: hypothetical protein J5J00_08955 [Deltaproteobacteria bacterium]|nr:hypothetical protein [Deltaproteobacteria bacterium]